MPNCKTGKVYEPRYKQRYGYLDYDGNLAIPIIYGYASRFVDGVAKVNLPDGEKKRWKGFLDKRLRKIININ